MKDSKESFMELFEDVKEYLQTQFDILTLTFTEQLSNVMSILVGKLVFIAFLLMAIFFGSLALAFYIGKQTGDTVTGFAAVAVGYLVIGILFLLIRTTWLKKVFLKLFANHIYNTEE